MRIVAVSDVTLGYGSPQLPLLATSLREHYLGHATVIEPAQPELPAKHHEFPQLDIRRVVTAEHPHSHLGRIEYIWRAANLVNELKPDVLVIVCTYCVPVLFRLKHRPKKVIYYSIESIPFYGDFDVEMNRHLSPLVDVVIFPEENRAVKEVGRCGFFGVAKVVLFNTANHREDGFQPMPAKQRNGRILYSGTLSKEQTFGDYYLSDKLRPVPIDLYGTVKGRTPGERQAFLDQLSSTAKYRGVVASSELARLRKAYCYSIVAWNPDNENQLYAAPNKFFESIADGIPPIAAPHPQCKLILDRYRCGILMTDWSFDSFTKAIRKAMDTFDTPDWEDMVSNCGRAVAAELTWDAQFDRLKQYLK
jgi:glycosyltransferase involved in cell wall biosynthesis